eukprot:1047675-Pleurochrysis_carterae.AAC.1
MCRVAEAPIASLPSKRLNSNGCHTIRVDKLSNTLCVERDHCGGAHASEMAHEILRVGQLDRAVVRDRDAVHLEQDVAHLGDAK